MIPPRIWTYWNSEKLPFIVRYCTATWKWFHPELEVIVLTPANVQQYLPAGIKLSAIHWNDSPAREADIVRLLVLAEHGGIWMDASIVLTGPLPFAFLAAMATHDFVGFYISGFTTQPQWPVIENWMFACTPESAFVCAWRDVFLRTDHFPNPDAYARYLDKQYDMQNIGLKTYLLMHLSAQAVLQTAVGGVADFDMQLFCAERGGPLTLLAANRWSASAAAADFAHNPSRYGTVHKLRGCDRGAFHDALLLRVHKQNYPDIPITQ